ncbi:MAG: hypothetical protein WBM40_03065, partial [Thiohalocapsa sp.]
MSDNEIGVRCLGCKATSVTLSLVDVLLRVSPDLRSKTIYELSCRGALISFLAQRSNSIICS